MALGKPTPFTQICSGLLFLGLCIFEYIFLNWLLDEWGKLAFLGGLFIILAFMLAVLKAMIYPSESNNKQLPK